MYSVAIADDEIGIREGLRDLVDWEGLGFSVAGVYSDGEDLLHLMENDPPHLVVSDIKMDRVGGLEVSRHIQKHHPNTRVVLISGYKEADLAMGAIKYGVKDYILKPIDLDELTACVGRLRAELDTEQAAQSQAHALERARNDLVEMREAFFEELMLGSLQNQQYIQRMFELIYPGLAFANSACFVLVLRIHRYDSFIRNEWTHSRSELHSYISNFVSIAARDIEYQLLAKRGDTLRLFGLLRSQPEGEPEPVIRHGVEDLCAELRGAFGVQVRVDSLEAWSSIPAMLAYKGTTTEGDLAGTLEKLREQQRILYSILREGDGESIAAAVAKFVACLNGLGVDTAREVAEDLLYTISAKLREDGLSPAVSLALEQGFACLAAADGHPGLAAALDNAFQCLGRALQDGQHSMVERAKEYIMRHISDDISLEDIAERFYLSQYHFSRTFKAKTGETLISFIIRCKMEHAMELLGSTHLKIYEVCERVGYSSLRHFTKLFKAHTGMTPSAFRQQRHIEVADDEA